MLSGPSCNFLPEGNFCPTVKLNFGKFNNFIVKKLVQLMIKKLNINGFLWPQNRIHPFLPLAFFHDQQNNHPTKSWVGFSPLTANCTISRLLKVVFPEAEGPAIKTIFTLSFRSCIRLAISAIFFSCNASRYFNNVATQPIDCVFVEISHIGYI